MPNQKKEELIQSAKLWKRLIAFVFDLFLINLILFSPFRGIIGDILPETTSFQETITYIQERPELIDSMNWIRIIMSGMVILYFTLMERLFSQTVGKMIMHIKVESLDEKLRVWQCLARSLFFIPLFPFGLFFIIEPISLLFVKDNRRTLELLSKTRTVEKQME